MVATCAPGIPFALRHAVFGIERIARRTAGLRAAAMAKSAPAARAAPATSAENSPESARSRGRPVPLVWAESGLALTGTLLAGDQDVRPHAPALIAAAVAALPDGVGRPRLRADSGL